jgi:DNA polymerase
MTELDRLESIVAACDKCKLCETATYKVFGEGNPKARLVFVGEAPGKEENASGRPFVGDAGKLLNKALAKISIERKSVYISNVVHCWPPRNRKPYSEETALCIGHLKAQIKIIKPKVLVALGATAMQTLAEIRSSIGKMRGKVMAGPSNTLVVPTWHPAYILRLGSIGKKSRQKQTAKEFLADVKLAFDVAEIPWTETE